jgi:hypothetical protein
MGELARASGVSCRASCVTGHLQVNCDFFSASGTVRMNLQMRDAEDKPLVCFTSHSSTPFVVIPILSILCIIIWVIWVIMSAMKHVNEPRSFSHRAAPHAWYGRPSLLRRGDGRWTGARMQRRLQGLPADAEPRCAPPLHHSPVFEFCLGKHSYRSVQPITANGIPPIQPVFQYGGRATARAC